MYLYLYSYRRETARQLRRYAQLTRCFSAVAELLVVSRNLRYMRIFAGFLGEGASKDIGLPTTSILSFLVAFSSETLDRIYRIYKLTRHLAPRLLFTDPKSLT